MKILKKALLWVGVGCAGLLTGILMFFCHILPLLRLRSVEAASVGIIGGADGPTAIMVTSHFSVWPLAALGAALLMGLAAFLLLRKGSLGKCRK